MNLVTASGKGSETHQKEKLVITEEHFQRVARSLIMHLRQHEEAVAQDGIPIMPSLSFFLLRFQYMKISIVMQAKPPLPLNCMPC